MLHRRIASAARVFAALLCLWLAAPASVLAQAGDGIVFLPGKALGLKPPAGFELSKTFAGFVHAESGSSFLLVQLPAAAFAEIKSGMTSEGLASQNITVTSNEPIKIDGYDGILVKGLQTAGENKVNKWILLLETPETAVLLTAQDLTGDSLDDATVLATLNSIQIRKPPPLDVQIASLPFTMGDLAGFRVVRTIAGSGVLLTKGPKDVVTDGSQPVLIIQRPIERPFPTSVFPADLSEQLLRAVKTLNVTSIGETVESTVAGADGYETIAKATDQVLKADVVVGQWLRLTSGEQMHALAILPTEGHEALLPDLRKLVAELSLKEQ